MDILATRPDTCYICNQHFKHYRKSHFDKKILLHEVELVTSHTACRNLIKKRDKLLQDLVEVEYDIFAKMN